ncbi:MAG TPA: 2,3-bisphosphoglycerate-independent phosphoglycerate mutase, partial [Candidatus Limnocylindrales bacterium]|nr:2,3-bisphosphoglycerate-independent phosphoglycerate mutase [Candidatus Limnocylindrales bacterium]
GGGVTPPESDGVTPPESDGVTAPDSDGVTPPESDGTTRGDREAPRGGRDGLAPQDADASTPATGEAVATTRSLATGRPRPVVLVVLDGFGIGRRPEADAIRAARMPVWRRLLAEWPNAALEASGEAVGLPAGQMGNSEVGHLNIGAGRPVLQDLPRIDAAIADRSFFRRPALLAACERARRTGRLHAISLVGPGGVHANDRHLVALAELAARDGVPEVRVHALLDGRDTPPRSAILFVADLEERLRAVHPNARIATVGGRYYGMDRDKRWDRTERAYDAIVYGVGERAPSAIAAIEAAYARDESDEFVRPTVIEGIDGRVRDGDPIVHCNFRADRARQLTHALADREFTAFDRSGPNGEPPPHDLLVVTMTEYEAGLPVEVAFPPEEARSLAHAFSDAGWRQFHVAETEKYAHVTYFFNGGREAPLPGEARLLVPSPKVPTYELQPEMSAPGVTDALVEAIRSGRYDFIVANYANPDMVGHTGDWEATIRALEVIDACLGRVVGAVEALEVADPAGPGPLLVVTADHGNADEMRTEDGQPVTAHSLNPVPIVVVGRAVRGRALRNGVLADVAPTILELVGMAPWPEITGRSLLVPAAVAAPRAVDRAAT